MPTLAEFLADFSKDFTGREWVFAETERWLATPDIPLFFIITGEPGIGKVAIAARLMQIRGPAAFHFCIGRQSDTIDPLIFVHSISLQLVDRYASFAQALAHSAHPQVSVQIRQPIKTVEHGADGKGAVIENLNFGGLSALVAFVHTVFQSLQLLAKRGIE
jgi:hypothetical protein